MYYLRGRGIFLVMPAKPNVSQLKNYEYFCIVIPGLIRDSTGSPP